MIIEVIDALATEENDVMMTLEETESQNLTDLVPIDQDVLEDEINTQH